MTENTPDCVCFDYSRLRGRTVEMGKTDKDVAAAAGMTPSTYSLKINGKGFFSQDQIIAICEYLGLPLTAIPVYFYTQTVQ